MRGPEDPKVVKGESAAWQHFIKIYDRHPELAGSKVVYAVCCHCQLLSTPESARQLVIINLLQPELIE